LVRNESRFENFGRNVNFEAEAYHEPRTEQEVLELLKAHEGQRIRAIGALHSWSRAPAGGEVVLSLRHLDDVRLVNDEMVEVGAGCSVFRLLQRLRALGKTLPTVGMTGEQSIAGAISTATHGSGKPSMSHYVSALRVASYDEEGTPTIRDITAGNALLAGRCALGRMGIIVSVQMRCVQPFKVEERSEAFSTIDLALAAAREYPLTQFYLMPWSWRWFAHLRRATAAPSSGLGARLKHRVVEGSNMMLLNLVAVLFGRTLKSKVWVRRIYRLLSRFHSATFVVDRAERLLMTQHRHHYVETELFVPTSRVREAADLIESVLRYVAGDDAALPEDASQCVASERRQLEEIRGRYVHHYPVTFRRVLKDSTLISMSSEQDVFAISLITFGRDLTAFETLVTALTSAMARVFDARPHWGKLLCIERDELERLIPALTEFQDECKRGDPKGAFASEFTERVLGI